MDKNNIITEKNNKKVLKIIAKIFIAFIAIQAVIAIILKILNIKGRKREKANDEREIKEYYAYMDGKQIYCEDTLFKGMIVRTIMGGVSINLANAIIKDDAFITIDTIMGGVSIKVPEGVNVKLDGKFTASGCSNTVPEYLDEDVPTLYIAAKALMSGIAVKVVETEDEEEIFAE